MATKRDTSANEKRRIRALRTSLNLSQTEFWNRVGTTQSAGSRYENDSIGAVGIPESIQQLLELAYGKNPLAALAKLRGTSVNELVAAGS